MSSRYPSLITVAIFVYCAWNSRELLHAWEGFHIERFSWIIFLAWGLPIILYWTIPTLFPNDKKSGSPILLGLALLFTLVGSLGSLNVIQHIGLALVLTAMLPWSWKLIPWFLTSVAWMPALGWFAVYGSVKWLFAARLLLATVGALWVIISYGLNHQKGTRHE